MSQLARGPHGAQGVHGGAGRAAAQACSVPGADHKRSTWCMQRVACRRAPPGAAQRLAVPTAGCMPTLLVRLSRPAAGYFDSEINKRGFWWVAGREGGCIRSRLWGWHWRRAGQAGGVASKGKLVHPERSVARCVALVMLCPASSRHAGATQQSVAPAMPCRPRGTRPPAPAGIRQQRCWAWCPGQSAGRPSWRPAPRCCTPAWGRCTPCCCWPSPLSLVRVACSYCACAFAAAAARLGLQRLAQTACRPELARPGPALQLLAALWAVSALWAVCVSGGWPSPAHRHTCCRGEHVPQILALVATQWQMLPAALEGTDLSSCCFKWTASARIAFLLQAGHV